MAKPIIAFRDGDGCRVVSFEIPGGVTTPAEFAEAVADITDRLAGARGVIIDGRGPVWGYAMLVHGAHATPWVATRDPRLGGAVVVQSHDPTRRVGEVMPFPEG
jgi:CRISPR-associated protein Csx3